MPAIPLKLSVVFKGQYLFAVLLLWLFLSNTTNALSQKTAAYYDSLTYASYQQQQWQQLKQEGKEALRSGYDNFYLRMRLGIACLETFNSSRAEAHFRAAQQFNPYDSSARLLLAKALQYQMKTVEAGHVYKYMRLREQRQSGIKEGFRPVSAHLDLGYVSRNNSTIRSFDQLTGSEGTFGQEHYYESNLFYDGGLYFQTAPDWLFYVGFQHIGITANDRFAWNDYLLQRDSVVTSTTGNAYYYSVKTNQQLEDFQHQLNQNAVYLQAQWGASDRWSLVAGFQYLKVDRDFTIPDVNDVVLSDTAYYNPADGAVEYFNMEVPESVFSTLSWSTTDYSLGLHGRLHLGLFTALAGIHTASINDTSVFQLSAGYQLMPFGNLRLVHQGEVFAIQRESKTGLAYRASLAWNASARLRLEADVLAGNLSNLSEQYGYIVYNNPEQVNLRAEAAVSYLFGQHLQLQLRYRLHDYTRQFDFIQSDIDGLISETYNLQSHTFIGGIKWIF